MNKLLAAESGEGGGAGTNFTNPFLKDTALEGLKGEEFLGKFLPKAVGLVLVFGAVAFFFMFVWGAISWMVSGGDKAGVESAKGKITNSIIGMVLLLGTFAIIGLIENFFGIDILSIDMGPLVIQ